MSTQTNHNHNHHHPDHQHQHQHQPNLLVILLTYRTTATTTHPLQQDVTKPTCRTAQEQHEGLLQGKVVPQPVNRLTKLRKIFELDSGEDNPIGKKTTFTMIRESGTEKKKMKTKGDSRKQDNSEDVKFSVEDNIRRRPGSLPASVDNCVSSGTDNTTAVHSSCATPQIEKSKQVT